MKLKHPFLVLAALIVLAAACGKEHGFRPKGLSKTPTSVRGWVDEVMPAGAAPITDPQLAQARNFELLADTSVSVEGIDFASGGVGSNGSFIILDVPPGDAIVNFNAPGAEAMLHLQGVPPNADVFIPYIALRGNKVVLLRPERLRIRVPSAKNERKRLPLFATIEGVKVPVDEVPVADLVDRRDYPDPHGSMVFPTVR